MTYAALALMAGSLSLALWSAGMLAPLQSAFVFVPKSQGLVLTAPGFWLSAGLIFAVSLAVAIDVGRFGARRAVLYLGGGFLGLAALSLFASWFFSIDVLFVPAVLAASISAVTAQIKRLRERDIELTEKLSASSWKFESIQGDDSEHRLLRGLHLLDTVLSPSEAIVFRRRGDGRLTSSARLRADQGNFLDTSRNSAWRDGVSLCERAMASGEIIVEKIETEDAATNIALPLRHEERTVGALLVRVSREFDDDNRALLTAIGGQMARNLQREEAHQATRKRSRIAFFSASESERRLESLYVLNGALLEQSVGVNALSEIGEGVALGYLDGRIAYANATLLALADVTEEETRNLSFFDLLDRFRTDIFDEPAIAVRRVLQSGDAYERELHFSDRDATYGLRISLVLDHSRQATNGAEARQLETAPSAGPDRALADARASAPLCLALVVKDLTLLKEYDQLRSDMISLMSHELRTPLTSINGFAELLMTDDELSEQSKEFVTIISNESQRLSRMINTFLEVTKLQRKDRQEVLKIPLRLDEVVKETIAGLQKVAKKRRIRLVEQPTQRLPPVAADKSMITQAIKNLVSNAIKYSPERTTVTVSTALEAEAVRLCVEDRGYGIPAEARDRVWEKFYRVVRDDQEKDEESTGLGLSFVREVVEQHGGTVDLESEVGRGSKFSFTLPRL
ncbi:MAG TPA: ATP-binding protein [Pyrinomonadaceae bacterium]|nr:ATP-binding protein [Pyrinomonadaceae bacterium]